MGLRERVKLALGQDASIVIDRSEIEKTVGFPVEHFVELGMTRSDLKKLERHGLAIRGYLRRLNQYKKPAGFEVRYALVSDLPKETPNAGTPEQK